MNLRRQHLLAVSLGIAALCVCSATRECRAQDGARLDRSWPPRSLLIRGQNSESEPEAGERPDAEFPEDEEDHIETDRDSFTPATTTAGQGKSIFEAAYSYIDNRDAYDTHSFPESILRYGLNERVELRLGWNYEVGGASNSVSGNSIGELEEGAKVERESAISYGLKFGVTEQDGWIPRSAFIAQAATPTRGTGTNTDFIGTYVFGWELENRWQLDASLRYFATSEESDHFNQWAPSVVLKVPVAEKWYAHVEYFSINTSGRAEETSSHYFSPGVHYLVTPNLEVGIRVGWGLTNDSANFFNNVGLGWRF